MALDLDVLSKISTMKEFAETHKPTHPLARHGPLRHGALRNRLLITPYDPPAFHKPTAKPSSSRTATPPSIASPSAAPSVQHAPSPCSTLPTPPAAAASTFSSPMHAAPTRLAPSLPAYAAPGPSDPQSISALLAQWLHESQQLNSRFTSEVGHIHSEIEELKALARQMVRRVGDDRDVVTWSKDEGDGEDDGETLCWGTDDEDADGEESTPASSSSAEGAGGGSLAASQVRDGPASANEAEEALSSQMSVSSEDTQMSDTASTASSA